MPVVGPNDDGRVATEDLASAVRDAEFFRSLVENGSDAIISIDENSTILYANQSVERVFGYEPEELIAERLTILMPERFHSDHFGAVDAYLETGERQLDWNEIQLPAEHKDGHEIQLSITFEEHVYEGERVFSGIMRDISDLIERERELERQNERLERFASIVSHDLRDPLNAARATARLAEAGEEDAFEDLFEIYDQVETLVEDLLVLARQGQSVGETEAVDLHTAVEDAWRIAGAETATLAVDDELHPIEADPDRLRSLFQNLFRNAIEHGGEEVTVRVGWADDTTLYVEDDGEGFGDADTDKLFQYGYTTNAGGTGFGLNIVREIVEAHGWSIAAMPATAGGARFVINTTGDGDGSAA